MPKYSVGDVVQIRDKDWYEKNKDEQGDVRFDGMEPFVRQMAFYCRRIAHIVKDDVRDYELDIDGGKWTWNDNMFED